MIDINIPVNEKFRLMETIKERNTEYNINTYMNMYMLIKQKIKANTCKNQFN